jgi:hypothetical protein
MGVGETAERATHKSLWEMVPFTPESRWTGSGALGGVEPLSLKGNSMRRAGAVADGVPGGPDFNMFSPVNVDSVSTLSGLSKLEEVVLDGADGVEVVTGTRANESQEGHLSLGRGFFLSRFNSFHFTRARRSYWFGVRMDGASYGRAASYEAYQRDGGSFGGAYRHGSGLSFGMRARWFSSRSTRYTGDKTKSGVFSFLFSTDRYREGGPSWKARVYYSGDEYKYLENGPEVEDDLWALGGALDLWPGGRGGAHRLSAGIRRENLQRSVADFIVPAELAGYGLPDEGSQRSVDASAVYSVRFWRSEKTCAKGAVRVDHKDLFGWEPSWALKLGRSLGAAGELAVEGGRFSFTPRFVDVYAPRDEAARPPWFFVSEMDAESEWMLSATWSLRSGAWEVSAGGFGASREHVLAPPAEWLGFNITPSPVPVEPVEDLGDGSAVGVWAAAGRRLGRYVRVGGSYSAIRSRAGGSAVPFTPEHKGGAWVLAEKSYFGDDMKVGIVLRGTLYSSQPTHLDFDLPSYGLADALGYVAISDITFFYQLKNLETKARGSSVLDAAAREYFFQPEPEVRFGLVWYLPG